MGMSEKLQGASGHWYEYLLANGDNLRAVSHQPGNFVFARSARSGSGGAVVVYVGQSHNLNAAFKGDGLSLWQYAGVKHAANMLMISIHANSSEEERQREVADLVQQHRPPMKGPGQGDPIVTH
jgi:hypothetical protein